MFEPLTGATAGWVLTSQGVDSIPAWQSIPVDIGATGATGSLVATNPAGIFSEVAPNATGTILISTGSASNPGYTNMSSLLTAGGGITLSGTTNVTIAVGVTGTTGAIVETTPSGALTALASGATNTVLTSNGVTNSFQYVGTSLGFTNFSLGNPTGTASASLVMMGLGATASYTPSRTGHCLLNWNFGATNAGANRVTGSANYGTGSAPTNGAASTGTSLSLNSWITVTAMMAACTVPGTATYVAKLTPSTSYWFDLAIGAPDTGTSAVTGVTFNLIEF